MHPELIELSVPEFLRGFLPDEITIYSYGTLIATGAILGYFYTAWKAKRQFNTSPDTVRSLVIFVILAAVIGGRFFYFFERPEYFFGNPGNMLSFSRSGFVFYGSLLFAIPTMLIFFKRNKIPTLPMLDIMAVTACIVHMFGRLGCFSAGCCHGIPHEGLFSVVFTNPLCKAPLNTPLFPSQLASATMIFAIMLVLLYLQRIKSFDGQVFLSYIGLYALGRGILEIFRGDYQRGYVIEGLLTHSQLISIFLIIGVIYFYLRLRKKSESTPEGN